MTKPTQWLNQTYQELVHDSSFMTVIGGNVPQFDEVLDERHDIVCCDGHVNMIFDRDYRLKTLIFSLSPDSAVCVRYIAAELTFFNQSTVIHDVLNTLGEPDEIGKAKKLPGLIKRGWLRYNRGFYRITFSIDNSDPDKIADVRFSASPNN